jgi:hypothetical protein
VLANFCKHWENANMPAEEIEPINHSELQVFINRASAVVATLSIARELLPESEEIWVFRKRSLLLGLDRMEAAAIEVQKSLNALQMGQPYGPGTAKGRVKSKKSPVKKAASKKKTGK